MNNKPILTKLMSLLTIAFFSLTMSAFAVSPPPDGGYANQNTAEGQNALFSLTTATENTAVTRQGLRLADDEQLRHVTVEVIPFKVPPSGVRFFLVLFQDLAKPAGPAAPEEARAQLAPGPAEQQVVQLQQELGALREHLQSVVQTRPDRLDGR